MPEVLLKMRGICKRFDDTDVLKNVDFDIFKGEVHALTGPNGAGKTTLMKILSGIECPDKGDIYLSSQKINIHNASEAQKYGIQMIYHETSLFPDMNVCENLFANKELFKKIGIIKVIQWKQMYKKARNYMKKFNLDIDIFSKIKQLSNSEIKMVEIIKTIMHGSRIIIMDEPSRDFDKNQIKQLFNIINRLKKAGISIIYITHRIDEIKMISDRLSILKDGNIVFSKPTCEITQDSIIKTLIDQEKDRFPRIQIKKGRELLRVENLCNEKIKNVSFTLREGEIIGMVGLKNSGRTALARCIFGVEPYIKGNIYINQKPKKISNTEEAVYNGLCYISYNSRLEGMFSDIEVYKNITSVNKNVLKIRKLNEKLKKIISAKYIDMLDIKPNSIYTKAGELSAGNQKKVMMAKWLFTNYKVMIFDRLTDSIDVCSKVDIYNILNELASSGTGIMLITNDIAEAVGMCDRVFVMADGRITKEFERPKISEEAIMYYLQKIE